MEVDLFADSSCQPVIRRLQLSFEHLGVLVVTHSAEMIIGKVWLPQHAVLVCVCSASWGRLCCDGNAVHPASMTVPDSKDLWHERMCSAF